METKKENKSVVENENNYKMEAPDGGWGYVIVAAMVVIFNVTAIPMAAFGLIYGDFLKNLGDEATGTALSNGLFNTVNSFTGLLTNALLNRYSYRKVGLAGSIIFVLGATALIFSQNLMHLLIFFGIIQGIGFGILMPAVMSAFNLYFDRKMNVMMSVSQALVVAFNMVVPQIVAWSMHIIGFRGTLMGLAILSSLSIPAMMTMQPVKRHMRKVFIQTTDATSIPMENLGQTKKSLPTDVLQAQIKPLLNQEKHLATSQKSLHSNHGRPRKSVVSLGDRIASVSNINEEDHFIKEDIIGTKQKDLSFWQSFIKSMDMSLLKEFKYINISLGLALCFSADIIFISIIPMMMGNIGFNDQEIATMMSVFFGSDLVSRILLTFISYVMTFRNRSLVLFASVFIAISRTALILYDGYMWKLIVLGILGFLRCFIQTPMVLVLADEYSEKFSSAFSLFMAMCGVVNLIIGPIISLVKSYTQSDVMVCHLLTLAYIICVISWTSELTFCRKKTKTEDQK